MTIDKFSSFPAWMHTKSICERYFIECNRPNKNTDLWVKWLNRVFRLKVDNSIIKLFINKTTTEKTMKSYSESYRTNIEVFYCHFECFDFHLFPNAFFSAFPAFIGFLAFFDFSDFWLFGFLAFRLSLSSADFISAISAFSPPFRFYCL